MIREIEYGEDGFIELDLSAEVKAYNTGIGSYEYWGCRGYDFGHTEFEVSNLQYDKSKYSESEIQIIEKYIIDNWSDIEEQLIDEFIEYHNNQNDEDF